MKRLAWAIPLCAWLTTGCIDVQQTITLERDLSGTAGFAVNVNLEPVAYMMAMLERGFSGKDGEPTAAEVAKARAEMLKDKKATAPIDFESERRDLERELPPGMRLVTATMESKELSFGINVVVAFERAALLADLGKPAPAAAKPKNASPLERLNNPIGQPFEGLRFVDHGAGFEISLPVSNPAKEGQGSGKGGAPLDAETSKQVQRMMGDLRVGMSITTPFEIVEHTAHRQEGRTLVWDYDFKKLEKLTPKEAKKGILVRYKK